MSRRKPRTVEHFPRMKVRGGRRRARQRHAAQRAAVKRFTDRVSETLVGLGAAFRPVVAAIEAMHTAMTSTPEYRPVDGAPWVVTR